MVFFIPVFLFFIVNIVFFMIYEYQNYTRIDIIGIIDLAYFLFFIFWFIFSFCALVFNLFQKNIKFLPYGIVFLYIFVSFSFPGYFNYAEFYVKAFIFRETFSSCGSDIGNKLEFKLCYAHDHYPYIQYLVVNPSHKMLVSHLEWDVNIKKDINNIDFIGAWDSCTEKKVYYLFGDIFLVNLRCE